MESLKISGEIKMTSAIIQSRDVTESKNYIKDVEKLFSRIPVINIYQLKKYLRKVYGENAFRGNIEYAINECLRRGIILSDGNYCFSKKAVYSAFKNKIEFNDYNVSETIRFKEKLVLKDEYYSLMKCFDFIIETLPFSADFYVSDEIFPIAYIDKEKQKLVQICYFPGNNIIEFGMLIDFKSKGLTDEMKEHLSRVAIVEDEKTAEIIGRTGFSSIVKFETNNEDIEMKLIETRKQRW